MPALLPTIFLLGAAQGAFLAFALIFSKGGNTRANHYLGCYILVFTCALLDYVLDSSGLTQQYVWIRTLLWPKEFLYGIFLYLYCREMTQPGLPQSTGLKLLLWTPPFFHACLSWPLLWLAPDIQYAILLNSEGLTGIYDLWRLLLGDIELGITIAHLSLAIFICLRLVHRHRQSMVQQFSSLQRRSLDWLRNILLGTLLVYSLWLAEEFFSEDLLGGQESLDQALALSMVVLIYALGWLGLRQPAIFQPGLPPPEASKPQTDSPGVIKQEPGMSAGASDHTSAVIADEVVDEVVEGADIAVGEKYARSALSAELAAGLMEQLRAHMTSERPYLNADISLGDLAAALGVSNNYLSQSINQQSGKNFFDFINSYRVEHTLPALAAGQASILSIATDSGFNSKSAFYAAFRKHQDMTPGQYRKQATAKTADATP